MTIEAPLVFLDTETTGLALTDDIWEFSAIRRDPNGIETGCGMFIEHSAEKAARLPERFRADLERRYNPPFVLTQKEAAREIASFLAPSPSGQKVHIVGAVPSFDTERIALLLARFGHKPEWHHHLIDVEALMVGHLAATGVSVALPWRSDDLSLAIGVQPPPEDLRHTATADALWTMRIWDRITSTEGDQPQ